MNRLVTSLLLALLSAAALAGRAARVPAAAGLRAEDPAIAAARRRHWAYQVPHPTPVPRVKNRSWVRNPIDAFILAQLERAGLQPAPPASKTALLRRVTFDLTGLPPTPEEVDAFLADRSPVAYEKVVDRLLASPRYGERWARHWLDLVRYADSNGYEHDEPRPDAWRYRDYVIRSLNADKPYDRFVREQLAGDLLQDGGTDGLIATGFALLGPDMTDAADQAVRRQVTLNDATDTVGLAFLGMTITCARCHDHKFEAVPQSDYYRLQGFFSSAEFRRDLNLASAAEREQFDAAMASYRVRLAPAQQELAGIEAPYREQILAAKRAALAEDVRTALDTAPAQRNAEQQLLAERAERALAIPPELIERSLSAADRDRYRACQERLRRLEPTRPAPLPVAMGLHEPGARTPIYILERGEFEARGAEVQPGFPIVLLSQGAPESRPSRLSLADWIASGDNPLAARVIVNRLWQHHFGRGIVPTPSDFGERGEPATHPALLDWLATTLMDGGTMEYYHSHAASVPPSDSPSPAPWSLKKMHYLMVTSNAYRQSSVALRESLAADPQNLLFSRMNRRRLEGEAVRDAVLAAARLLDFKMGGPGVIAPAAEPVEAAKTRKGISRATDAARRSIYLFVRRNVRAPLLEALDAPDTNLSCPRREVTTTAPQALALLNAPEIRRAAGALAERVAREAGPSTGACIARAYRLALCRSPGRRESELALEFLDRQKELLQAQPDAAHAALADFCLALFNLNEFVYVD